MENKVPHVQFHGEQAGTMAETADRRYAFAYDKTWLKSGFPISPFSLPLEETVFVPGSRTFGGLWGIFADSLPDAWGRLLEDRMPKSKGIEPTSVGRLDRLAIVRASGMGALINSPAWDTQQEGRIKDLDQLTKVASKC